MPNTVRFHRVLRAPAERIYRAFLDAVCPMTLELGRTKFRQYPVPFTEYQAARAEDLSRETKQAEEQAAFKLDDIYCPECADAVERTLRAASYQRGPSRLGA